jgi:hypothetical protein
MKLTIKNYKKATGWSFSYDRNSTDFWKIYSVEETNLSYQFSLVLEDNNGNRLASKQIVLSRKSILTDVGEIRYEFLPHRRQIVSAKWFSDTDNVYKAFQSELTSNL